MSNKNKKSNEIFKHKKEIIIGSVFLVAVIFSVIFLIVNNNDKTNDNDSNNENNVVENDNNETDNNVDEDSKAVTEEDIISVYNFSKEDAKKLVMDTFNSDNFEFTVSISNDAKYIVTAKNTINDEVYKYEVDPMSKTYVEL